MNIYVMIDTTANVVISKSNEVFLKINAEPHIEYELRDHSNLKFPMPSSCLNTGAEIGMEKFIYTI